MQIATNYRLRYFSLNHELNELYELLTPYKKIKDYEDFI